MNIGTISSFVYLCIGFITLLWLRRVAVANSSNRPKHATPHVKRTVSDADYHSCTRCQTITIILSDEWPRTGPDLLIRLPHTVSEICQAAADGCPFFKELHDVCAIPLVNKIILHTRVFGSIFKSSSFLHAFTSCATLKERVVYFFRGLSDRPFHMRIGRLNVEAGGSLYVRLLYIASHSFEIDLSADYDDHAAQYIMERPLRLEVNSDHTFEQARRWLHECTNGDPSHNQCQSESRTFAPTRLIEVRRHSSGSFIPRIYHSKRDERVEWACLSYCWGGDQACKTTRARLTERVNLLPFGDLPETLRDAIVVANRIGIRFIWIDALCIVQDDPDDIAREISVMPEIYKNGICTISASRSSSSKEGFLQIHETEQMHEKPMKVKVRCPDGQPGSVKLAYRGAEYRYGIEPIHKRAWCFQERLLSSRILDFERTQLRWTCLSKVEVDGGKANLAAATDRLIGKSLQGLTRDRLHESWQDTVSAYTRRDLTFGGDKLVAISAVASEYAPHFNDDYLAGLWRRSLARQLAWMAGRPRKPRHQTYVAPSWSWASAPDRIYWDASSDGESAVHIIDCQVQLAHSYAPFGSVTGGFIILKGQMRDAIWYVNRGELQMQVGSEELRFFSKRDILEPSPGHGKTHFLGWPSADAVVEEWDQDPDQSVNVHCLKIRERGEKAGTRCLFLLPTDKARISYKRIASFDIGDGRYRYDPPIERDFFEDIELEEITIV